jgi:hypothetical protein
MVAKMEAYSQRLCTNTFGGLALSYLSLKDIQREKRFTMRPKDWRDYLAIRKRLHTKKTTKV